MRARGPSYSPLLGVRLDNHKSTLGKKEKAAWTNEGTKRDQRGALGKEYVSGNSLSLAVNGYTFDAFVVLEEMPEL